MTEPNRLPPELEIAAEIDSQPENVCELIHMRLL